MPGWSAGFSRARPRRSTLFLSAPPFYVALLWTYDLLGQMENVADPASDEEGLTLPMARERARAREKEELDSDF